MVRHSLLLACLLACAFPQDAQSLPAFSAGENHVLAVTDEGRVIAFGRNDMGQLGLGSQLSSTLPIPVPGLDGILAVAAGSDASLAIGRNGRVWRWGIGGAQTCDFGTINLPCTKVPTPVADLIGARSASVGAENALMVMANGSIYRVDSYTSPTQIVGFGGALKAQVAEGFNVALKTDGTVWTWGSHARGQLGIGSMAPATCTERNPYALGGPFGAVPCATTPVRVPGLDGVVDIAARGRFTLALKADGTVWAWGSNRYGQLGDGTTLDRASPVRVGIAPRVRGIAASFGSGFAQLADNSLRAWGLLPTDTPGREFCGTGITCSRNPIVLSQPSLDGVVTITAGNLNGYGVRGDGLLVAFGQVPDGDPAVPFDFRIVGLGANGSGGSVGTGSGGNIILGTLTSGLAFPMTLEGTASAPLRTLFTNASGPTRFTGITTSAGFTASHECPMPIPTGGQCEIMTRFTPASTGPFAGTLRIATDSPAVGTVQATLSGYGVSRDGVNFTSLWWDETEPGWGLNLNQQGALIFATLFTYANDGQGLWLVASGLAAQADGSYTGSLYRTSGPPFNRVPWTSVSVQEVGTMTLRFTTPQRGTLEYSFNGSKVYKSIRQQVFASPVPTCVPSTAARGAGSNAQDLWWNSAESGWGLNLTQQGSVIFATLFTYDGNGRDMWLVASGLTPAPGGGYSGSLFRTQGPAFNTYPWLPATVSTVGTMSIAFTGADAATLRYTYEGINVIKAIRRQTFGTTFPICR